MKRTRSNQCRSRVPVGSSEQSSVTPIRRYLRQACGRAGVLLSLSVAACSNSLSPAGPASDAGGTGATTSSGGGGASGASGASAGGAGGTGATSGAGGAQGGTQEPGASRHRQQGRPSPEQYRVRQHAARPVADGVAFWGGLRRGGSGRVRQHRDGAFDEPASSRRLLCRGTNRERQRVRGSCVARSHRPLRPSCWTPPVPTP